MADMNLNNATIINNNTDNNSQEESCMNDTNSTIIAVNHLMNFFKNTDEEKYANFFKGGDDTQVNLCMAKIKKIMSELNSARSDLATAYANKYEGTYERTERPTLFRYIDKNNNHHYYDIAGTKIDVADFVETGYNTINLDTKTGYTHMVDGYCFDLGSIIIKRFKYKVATNNDSCSFTMENEFIVPFFDETGYDKDGLSTSVYYTFTSTLNQYNSSEFLDKMYNINRNFELGLGDMRKYYHSNPAFEVIIKTAPEEIIKELLSRNNIEKSQPVYKLLDMDKETYELAAEKKVLREYADLQLHIKRKDLFHKTETEWIDLILDAKEKEETFKFFQVEYTGWRYNKSSSPILKYLAENYANQDIFSSNYSFGKFYKYVTEEVINQGYSQLYAFVGELKDYLEICNRQGGTPALFTGYLSQTHDIASRNYKLFLDAHQEEIFCQRYKDFKTITSGLGNGKYYLIAPKNGNDLKVEGSNLCHCVGSYIKRVLDGDTLIFFLRKDPEESLITIEVNNKKVIQCRGMHNRKASYEEMKALSDIATKAGWEISLWY